MKAVVFDVGGVLLDWNPRYLYRKLFDGDEVAMETFLAEVCSPSWNRDADREPTLRQSCTRLCGQFPHHAALIAAYDTRWEEMVAGAFEDTVQVLEGLQQAGVPLYGLTNFVSEKFRRMQRAYGFFDHFAGILVSGDVGMVKPEPEIFRCLLATFGLAAETVVFIDDQPANVAAAVALGMDAIQFENAASLRAALRGRGFNLPAVQGSFCAPGD